MGRHQNNAPAFVKDIEYFLLFPEFPAYRLCAKDTDHCPVYQRLTKAEVDGVAVSEPFDETLPPKPPGEIIIRLFSYRRQKEDVEEHNKRKNKICKPSARAPDDEIEKFVSEGGTDAPACPLLSPGTRKVMVSCF